MIVHYTEPYLIHPQHRITIDLVGLGGTGSMVLSNLARMNHALIGLNHPGLFVRAWDSDQVTNSNIGRQMFSPVDIDQNKATVLISRINQFFSTDWEAQPIKYTGSKTSNIIITCIDTAKGRIEIGERLLKFKDNGEPFDFPYYWLDIGNLQNTGQCVLGTLNMIPQPRVKGTKLKAVLPTVVKMFPQLKRIKEETQGPSCSLAEALEKQDLFINSSLAQFGMALLWKLIKQGNISQHGCFVNLETMTVNPIKIK